MNSKISADSNSLNQHLPYSSWILKFSNKEHCSHNSANHMLVNKVVKITQYTSKLFFMKLFNVNTNIFTGALISKRVTKYLLTVNIEGCSNLSFF